MMWMWPDVRLRPDRVFCSIYRGVLYILACQGEMYTSKGIFDVEWF